MNKVARFISVIGHPLLTIPVFVLIVMYRFESFETASKISLLIIGCFFIPLILWMFIKSRNGSYTNFDVSNRLQRRSLYVFAVPLLSAVTIILFVTGQSPNTCFSVLFALVLMIFSMVVNFFVKSSLHVSLNIFLAALVFDIDKRIAVAVLLFTGLLCWSRIKLGRHTLLEVVFGILVGTIVGLMMTLFQKYVLV
jgi:membrane-associated phospholipid phosphatase